MSIKADVDRYIKAYPHLAWINVDCTPRGGKRILGGSSYRDRELTFTGESRATKLRKEAERERSFKEAQQDAFQSSASNESQET